MLIEKFLSPKSLKQLCQYISAKQEMRKTQGTIFKKEISEGERFVNQVDSDFSVVDFLTGN